LTLEAWCWLAGLVCLACAARPEASLKPPTPPHSFQLTVDGDIFRGADSFGFVSAQSLESGDKFRLKIRSTQRVQVYVAYCDANQTLQTYPASGAIHAEPGSELYLPESGSFVVDKNLGRETLYVVASTSPLETTDPALAHQLSAKAGQGGQACAPALEMTTNESRASLGLSPLAVDPPPASAPTVVVAPAAVAGAGKKMRSMPHRKDVPDEWRPRGIGVTAGSTAASSVGSDASGIAILAFRKDHPR